VGLLDRIRRQGTPKTPEEADALALRQLAGRGADLSKPRHVIHFLYFAAEGEARAAAAAIDDTSWSTSIEAPVEETAQWCVRADGDRIMSSETTAALRSWFEQLAARHGGEYDGWEAAAKP
jgi:uncharacterized membrane-anchored protein